jgi:hypothetical protein
MRRAVVTVALLGAVLPVVVSPQAASAAIVSSISFKASVHSTYNHTTGGGAFNDGSVTWVKGELQGTDYACGDLTTYLFTLVTSAEQASADVELTLEYTADSTGQSGVALIPLTDPDNLRVNSGLIPNRAGTGFTGTASGYDAGFRGTYTGETTPASVATDPVPIVSPIGDVYTSGAKQRLTFTVKDLPASSTTVVRSDARIFCKPGSRPTGNLQASLISARVTAPVVQAVSGGNQTVNFRGVGNLGGLSSPMLQVSKEVYDASTTPTCPTEPQGQTVLTVTTAPFTARYCYWVYNWAAATANGVTLVDDMAGLTDDPRSITLTFPTAGTSLTGGGSVATGTTTYEFTESGIYTNVATASATNGGSAEAGTATLTLRTGLVLTKKVVLGDAGATPSLCDDAVDRLNLLTVDPGPVQVSYCYTLVNYGETDLLDMTLVDDEAIAGNPSPRSLTLVGLSDSTHATDTDVDPDDLPIDATATAVWVTDLASSAAATFRNTATASFTVAGGGSGSKSDTARVSFRVPTPRLSMTKIQTNDDPVVVGDVIYYELRVENTGDLDVDDISVVDDNAVIDGCTPDLEELTLEPGGTVTCQASRTVTQADVDAGEVLNVASVTGDADGVEVSDESNGVVTPIVQTPALAVTKVAVSDGPHELGSRVRYRIVAANVGNVTLDDVVVNDSKADAVSCTPSTPTSLSPGDEITCVARKRVTESDIAAGRVVNVATAAGVDPNGEPVSQRSNRVVVPLSACETARSADDTCPAELTIDLEQTSPAPGKPGDLVRYRGTITNTGGQTVYDVSPTADNWVIESCDPEAPATLAVGESMVCVGYHVTTPEDLAAGRIDVGLSAAGRAADGSTVATDQPTVATPIGELPQTGVLFVERLVPWTLALLFTGVGLLGLSRLRRRII